MSSQALPQLQGSRTHRAAEKDLLSRGRRKFDGSKTARVPGKKSGRKLYTSTIPGLASPYENVYSRAMTAGGSPLATQMDEQAALEFEFELYRQSIHQRRVEASRARQLQQQKFDQERAKAEKERVLLAEAAEIERRRRVSQKIARVRAKARKEQKEQERAQQEEEKRKQEYMEQLHEERYVLVERQKRERQKMRSLLKMEQEKALQNFHSYEKNVRRRKVELQSIIRTQLAEDLKKKKARRRRELRERKQSKHVFQPPVFQQPEDQGFFITENFGGDEEAYATEPLTLEQEAAIDQEASVLAQNIIDDAILFSSY